MAVTENNITSTGATSYTFTFEYLKTTDVKISVNGTATTEYTIPSGAPTTVQFNSGHVPASGAAIRIYRNTNVDNLEATFYAGSAIKSQDLNDNFNQNLYVTQEAKRDVDSAWQSGDETINSTETWQSDNTRVATTGAIDGRIDSKIDSALTDDVVAGSSISISDNTPSSGKITLNVIAATGSNSGSLSASDKTKLDGIDIGAKDDQTAAEIRVLVESATDSNVFTDNDHSRLNAMEDNATSDQTASEIKTLLQSDKLTDSEIELPTFTLVSVAPNFFAKSKQYEALFIRYS